MKAIVIPNALILHLDRSDPDEGVWRTIDTRFYSDPLNYKRTPVRHGSYIALSDADSIPMIIDSID